MVQQLLLWAKERGASTMAWDRLQAALAATGTVSYVVSLESHSIIMVSEN